jgi:hypothetical protein
LEELMLSRHRIEPKLPPAGKVHSRGDR